MPGMRGEAAYALSRSYTKKAIGGYTPTGGETGFDYEQPTPAATWTITHSLGDRYPCVICLDEDGNIITGDINYYSDNVTIIKFAVPLKGRARLNHGGGSGGGGGSDTAHVVLDKADYDAIPVKNPNTIYLIRG